MQPFLADAANRPPDLAIVKKDRLADAHAAEHFSERTRHECRFSQLAVVVSRTTTGSVPMHDVQGIARAQRNPPFDRRQRAHLALRDRRPLPPQGEARSGHDICSPVSFAQALAWMNFTNAKHPL